jgi:hypothetical protein
MWKAVRVSLLLGVLLVVASSTYFEQRRAHAWRYPQELGVFPVAGDDSVATFEYLAHLSAAEFADIESFMAEQAASYGLALREPVRVRLYPRLAPLPPPPPAPGATLAAVWWSLRLRWFAARHGHGVDGSTPQIRMFVVYHDPALAPRLVHSAGLQKGLIGVAHLFAVPRMRGSNSVVIAHEYLHTLGATDKYDPATDAPVYPQGFAEPARDPRYPQRFAELMAGRRPLTPTTQEMPDSLERCVIGEATAAEIHWVGR